jgi:hypothetical protein
MSGSSISLSMAIEACRVPFLGEPLRHETLPPLLEPSASEVVGVHVVRIFVGVGI